MKTKRLEKTFRYWIPIALTATVLSGLVYFTVQQELRMGANDPQIQTAEDIAVALSRNRDIASVVPTQQVDITNSLAPFVIVYNDQGNVVSSSATLHGQIPLFPKDVFTNVRGNGEERLTWQPESQVRIATVVTRYAGVQQGFVIVGRSLREVEKREDSLMHQVALAWGTSLISSFIITLLLIP